MSAACIGALSPAQRQQQPSRLSGSLAGNLQAHIEPLLEPCWADMLLVTSVCIILLPGCLLFASPQAGRAGSSRSLQGRRNCTACHDSLLSSRSTMVPEGGIGLLLDCCHDQQNSLSNCSTMQALTTPFSILQTPHCLFCSPRLRQVR